MSRKRRSITLKLILVSTLTASCAACIAAVAAYGIGRSVLESEIHERLKTSAPDRERQLLGWLYQQQEHASLVANRTTLRSLLGSRATIPPSEFADRAGKILFEADEAIYGFVDLWITDADGAVLVATSPNYMSKNYAHDPRFEVGKLRNYVGVPYDEDGLPFLSIAVPMLADKSDGPVLGVLMVTIDAAPLFSILRDRTGLGETGQVLVATQSGDHLNFLVPRIDGTRQMAATEFPALVRAIKGESGFQVVHSDGHEVLAIYRPLSIAAGDNKSWGLVAQISADEAYAPLHILRTWILVNTIVLIGLGALASAWMARRLSKPLRDLAAAAKAVAAGDLNRSVAIHTDDELEDLSTAFNDMTRKLRGALEHLEAQVAARTEALTRNEWRLAMAIEASGAGVFHYRIPLGPDTYYSERWAQILGYELKDLPPFHEMAAWTKRLFHPDDLQPFLDGYRAFVRGESEIHQTEARMRHRDGRWLVIASHYKAIERASDGHAIHVVGVVIDISQKKALEEGLWQAQKLDAVGQLASGVAHEINNLLMGINGCARIVQDKLDDDHYAHQYLDQIRAAVETGGQVTRQLLAFAGKGSTAFSVFDLNKCVTHSVKLLKSAAGDHAELAIDLGQNESLVQSDERLLVLVLLNLTLNARDACQQQGTVTIRVDNVTINADEAENLPGVEAGDYVEVRVIDNGCGMDAETRRRAFEPFYTTKPVGKGTGLGLSTVYALVTQMRGHIDLISEVDKGTTVRILLPRVQQMPTSQGLRSGEPELKLPRRGEFVEPRAAASGQRV